jgi:hypothetical protein
MVFFPIIILADFNLFRLETPLKRTPDPSFAPIKKQ